MNTLTEAPAYEIIDLRPGNDSRPRPIDYERMKAEHPKARRAVERAVKTGDPVKVAEKVIAAVQLWDECGAWPDNWSYAQRALDDVLPWNRQVQLEDVAYGRVLIRRKKSND